MHETLQKEQAAAAPPGELNPAQAEAVCHGDGPALVIAGAGSGKTRTLVHRVAWLIGQGVPPESILLLTFTRRAAQEMLARASRLTGTACRGVMGGTFHATANVLLRRHGLHIGVPRGFTIIDRADAESIVNLIKSSLGLGGRGSGFPSKRVIVNILSGTVNRAMDLDDLVHDRYAHLAEFIGDFHDIVRHYQQFKDDHLLMDYDDLLVRWRDLLLHPGGRQDCAGGFSHILVDEYQDTNHIQAEIVRLLAHGHGNVMVVGDDAQSIYSFRGADFSNIMRFPEVFPGCRVIRLEQNYRSTQAVLDLGNAVIQRARERFTKTLFTELGQGTKPVLMPAPSEPAEASRVANLVKERLAAGEPPGEVAVLFRSAYHSYKLEMELGSLGIGFEKRGGLKLAESAHVKDVLSFLRVVVNPADHLSWNRLLLMLPKVGPKTAQKILGAAMESADPVQVLAGWKSRAAWADRLRDLAGLLEELRGPGMGPPACFDRLMDYYEPLLQQLYADDYPRRRADLEQLRTIMGEYADLGTFLDDTTLDPPETMLAPGETEGLVVLSTIHSAKGLEWNTVIVIGLCEGRFPQNAQAPVDQIEEERRLLYVAVTRARQRLYLSYSRSLSSSERGLRPTVLSPFLREVNPGLYEVDEPRPPAGARNGAAATDSLGPGFFRRRKKRASLADFPCEARVRHPLFGTGRVVRQSPPRQVEVAFERHGTKLLHLDYARLELVES